MSESISETIDDGGPAMPIVETDPRCGTRIYYGLSMLDYFAGQALCGLTANPEFRGMTQEECAASAYEAAICMLNAREAIQARGAK